jgi:hypothetical protein
MISEVGGRKKQKSIFIFFLAKFTNLHRYEDVVAAMQTNAKRGSQVTLMGTAVQ